MISPMITPSTAVFQSEGSVSDELIGRQRELADAVIDVFVRQLKLIHAMMVELPFAWVTARDSEPRAPAVDPAPVIDPPPVAYSPPAVDEAPAVEEAPAADKAPAAAPLAAPAVTAAAMIAANLEEDLLPATRKRKKSAGEAQISQEAVKAASSKPPGKKPPRKGPPPTPLH